MKSMSETRERVGFTRKVKSLVESRELHSMGLSILEVRDSAVLKFE